jgi:hypothetical protein
MTKDSPDSLKIKATLNKALHSDLISLLFATPMYYRAKRLIQLAELGLKVEQAGGIDSAKLAISNLGGVSLATSILNDKEQLHESSDDKTKKRQSSMPEELASAFVTESLESMQQMGE